MEKSSKLIGIHDMITKKDYCDYETCVALKELGYKVPTSAYYMPNNNQLLFVSNPFRGGYVIDCFYSHNSLPKDVMTSNYIDAPTMWEAQKWLREERGMLLQPAYLELSDEWICVIRDKNKRHGYSAQKQKNYEEALSEGIKKTVEILKEE